MMVEQIFPILQCLSYNASDNVLISPQNHSLHDRGEMVLAEEILEEIHCYYLEHIAVLLYLQIETMDFLEDFTTNS